jgi:CheY-like chemotaxis protein
MVPAAAPRRRSADSDFPPTRPMVRSALSGAAAERAPAAAAAPARSADTPSRQLSDRAARPGVMRLTDFGGLDELPSPPSRTPRSRSPKSLSAGSQGGVPPVQRGDMLLVAESLVEGRILHKRFKKYGLSIDWSREGKQALVMMKAHAYRLVVVDRLDGEPDAYQVCRTAKQTRQPNGQPPVVIMFAPSAGSMDRIKAGLAGSDAYLSRSVAESEFYKVLAQHRLVSLDGFAKTNVGF